ncbi:MAG TPA: alpha/beta hydrolase [Coriobacteriia bacterium]|nr:alpha/beta hydrolase [Coriobacteriia bacterium]
MTALLLIGSGCTYLPPEAQRLWAHDHLAYRNLAYGSASGSQKLDLYVPLTGTKPYPLIIYVHGGGFVRGDKSRELPRLQAEADARGYAVASIDYRRLKEARFPAQVQDAKAAVAWLRKNADGYGLDSKRFAIWGVSAGGNIAALVGTTGDSDVFAPAGTQPGHYDSLVQAVVDWYGPADFASIERYDERRQMGGSSPPVLEDAADQITAQPKLDAETDPATEADQNDPPIFIAHGNRDTVVSVQQSIDLADALKRRMGSTKVELVIVKGAGHRQLQIGTPAMMTRVFDWLDDELVRLQPAP